MKSFLGSRGDFSKKPLAAGGKKDLKNNPFLIYTLYRKEKEPW
jgi:hypothetical protein